MANMSLRDFYSELDQRMARPDEDWEAYILRVQACAAQTGASAFSEASPARTNMCATGDVGEDGNGDVWRAEAALNGRQDNAQRTAEAKRRELSSRVPMRTGRIFTLLFPYA